MSRNVDVRDFVENRADDGRAVALENAAAAASQRLAGEERVVVTQIDATTGNPAMVASEAAPAGGGDVVRRAIDHLTTIGPVLGLSPVQAPEFLPDPQVQQTSSGGRTVHVQQQYKGIPIFQAASTVRFAPGGELSSTAGSTITIDDDLAVTTTRTALDAVRIAAAHVAEPTADERGGTDSFGEPYVPARVDVTDYRPAVRSTVPGSPNRATVVDGGPFAGDIPASLVWFPMARNALLAWMVTLTMPGEAEQYKAVVDANSDRVLYCRQMVQSIGVRGNVHRRDGGGSRTMTDFPLPRSAYPADTTENPRGPVAVEGFPAPWVSGEETSGNAVRAHLGVDGATTTGTVADGVLVFDPPDDHGDDQKVLNIFYLNCFIHDYFYLLGFREKDGNFQQDNLGRGGLAGDRVDARAHSGAVTGTANMVTRADGTSPIMNMGLVANTGRHTAFDSGVVFHEFMHGVTNRLVGGPMNTNNLDSPQSRGMGEGWGDYVACTINETSIIGSWVTGRPEGIRKYRYDADFPDGFGDLGTGRYTEEHNIGEIWCATLLQINRNIRADRAMPLVVDALKLAPANPSFLNMRDAILEALANAFGAGRYYLSHHDVAFDGMWAAFAQFGMGVHARCNGAQLTGIVGDHTRPPLRSGHDQWPSARPTRLPPPPPKPKPIRVRMP